MPLDAELGYAIPRDALAALIRHYGGTVLYVPVNPAGLTFDELAATVGGAVARRIVGIAGGDQLYVPCGTAACREQRNVAIRALAERGVSPDRIAREHVFLERLTTRHVYRILQQDP
jgi:hypothetical protein